MAVIRDCVILNSSSQSLFIGDKTQLGFFNLVNLSLGVVERDGFYVFVEIERGKRKKEVSSDAS